MKYFTDQEYRLVLSALGRERKVCEMVEKDCGEEHCVIKDVNARMYVTNKECSLEDAEIALLDKFEGVCQTEVSLSGYSEWTITGMDVDEFKIGGHDIEQILQSNIGKYVHFIIEC